MSYHNDCSAFKKFSKVFHDDFFIDNNWTQQDQDELKSVMDEYYDRVGWDKTTGWPTRQTLEAQNLKAVADELEGIGKLP